MNVSVVHYTLGFGVIDFFVTNYGDLMKKTLTVSS